MLIESAYDAVVAVTALTAYDAVCAVLIYDEVVANDADTALDAVLANDADSIVPVRNDAVVANEADATVPVKNDAVAANEADVALEAVTLVNPDPFPINDPVNDPVAYISAEPVPSNASIILVICEASIVPPFAIPDLLILAIIFYLSSCILANFLFFH